MKILALEFSSAQRSVAVVGQASCLSREANAAATLKQLSKISTPLNRQDACPTVCEVIETSAGRTMQPFQMIETALAQAGLDRAQIECVVVGLGPGSYNGIRAGIAIAQGWQLAGHVKLLGVSSAEAVAAQAHADGLRGTALVIVDAQRGEWYLGAWELTDAGIRETEPLRIVGAETVLRRAAMGGTVIGPEATRLLPGAQPVFPRAAMLAQLARPRSSFVIGENLEPIYLRETSFVKAPPARIV